MKKILFFLAIASLIFGSCGKDAGSSPSSFSFTVNSSTFTVDASALPTATNFLVSLVSSESASSAFSDEFYLGGKTKSLSAEKITLCNDAYFSIIAFDSEGKYVTQNFFPFVEGGQTLTLSDEE
ncbi:MAG TPA: hypothetical protein PKK65_03155 [bacterium]|nr:hypothetical protein [bacterium]